MGVVFRQSIKSTAITLVGAILGAVMVFASSNLMPIQELGFTRNLTNQVVVASFFILLGMASTLFLYFHRFDNEQEHEKRAVFLSLCFLSPLVVFLLTIVPYFVFQDWFLHKFFQAKDIPFLKRYMLCFPLYTLFFLYTTLFEHYLLTQLKSAATTFVREIMLKLLNLILVLLFGFNFISFDVFIYSFVGINLLAVFILFLLARKNESFRFSTNWQLLSRAEYKAIFSFSGYHAFMSLSIFLFGFLDSIILASQNKAGLDAIPIYTNAVFISGVIVIPYRAMGGIASADISKAYAEKNHEKVKDIYGRSGLNILIASVFMLCIIVCNLHNAIALLPPIYNAVFWVTLIMLIGKFADTATGLNDVALNMSPYFRFNFYSSIAVVIVFVIALRLAIPCYGVYGAAWVFAGALVLFNGLKTLFVWRKLRLQPYSIGSAKTLLIGAIVIALGLAIPKMQNPYWDTILRSIILTISFVGLVLWLRPSKDISHYIAETLKKKKLF